MFCNFVYDGISSKNQNVFCVHFQEEELTQTGGSECELITYKNNRTNRWRLGSANYINPLQFTIQIINTDETPIDVKKERYLNRWLLNYKNQYKWLQIENDDYIDIYFRCKFTNPQRLVVGGNVCGMQYTVICDSPWGYSALRTKKFNFTENEGQLDIYNDSDEFDFIYPQMSITLNEDCGLRIDNSYDSDRQFTIENCTQNEIITVDNEYQIITTNSSSHPYILGDFNKHWLRLAHGYNHFTFSNDCDVEIKYRTIRKAGI